MGPDTLYFLAAGSGAVALLYSSVGHGGASGYIALMSLLGMAPSEIKPIALLLNVLVAGIGTWQFFRAGHFSWTLFWPFALLSAPCAFFGGYLNLPSGLFSNLLGGLLLLSALQFVVRPPMERPPRPVRTPLALGVGGGVGLISGLTGTGGGIFLTPVLIVAGWAPTRSAAAVSAPFILLNSLAGLVGTLAAGGHFPDLAGALFLAVAGILGGTLGSYLGSRRLPSPVLKRLLALVLTIAGVKLLMV